MATSEVQDGIFCEVCEDDSGPPLAVAICHPCREFYCSICVKRHKKFRATADHQLVYFKGKSKEEVTEKWVCDICETADAVNVCKVCKQLYCRQCSAMHSKIKATKTHLLLAIEVLQSQSADGEPELSSDFEGSLKIVPTSSSAQAPVPSNQVEARTVSKVSSKRNDAQKGENRVINFKEETEFTVKLTTEKNCYITSIATLPDNKILLIDHDNGCLKVFDTNFHFLYSVEKVGNSFGVVAITGQEIAIINSNKIEFYDLGRHKNKKLEKVFEVKAFARDICYRSAKLAVVYTSGKLQGVQVFDMAGHVINDNVINTVNELQVSLGYSIEFNKDGTVYFIKASIPEKDSIIVAYSVSGHFLWVTDIEGGLMDFGFVDDHLLVFCGHSHVLKVSPDEGTKKKIGETNRSASCLHINQDLKKMFYANVLQNAIYVLNYP